MLVAFALWLVACAPSAAYAAEDLMAAANLGAPSSLIEPQAQDDPNQLTPQSSSAELSDDGQDYGWLYRRGDYWYAIGDEPQGLENARYVQYENRVYTAEDYRNGEHKKAPTGVEEISYTDGTVMYRYGSHILLDPIVKGARIACRGGGTVPLWGRRRLLPVNGLDNPMRIAGYSTLNTFMLRMASTARSRTSFMRSTFLQNSIAMEHSRLAPAKTIKTSPNQWKEYTNAPKYLL